MRENDALTEHQRIVSRIHPDWQEIIFSPEFETWLDRHPMGVAYRVVIFSEDEALRLAIGATPLSSIFILGEFKNNLVIQKPKKCGFSGLSGFVDASIVH